MSRKNDSVFLDSRRVCSDDCAKEARDLQNDGVFGYTTYKHMPVACKDPQGSTPGFMYDHVNLHGRPGYGVAEDCVVDRYSALRNDPNQLTRDRCRQQLFSRIFQGCPNLKPGVADPDKEMPLLQGSSSGDFVPPGKAPASCKRAIMEQETRGFWPLIDCVKEVQKEEHIVEPWVRGGDDTRSYVRRQEFLNKCGMKDPRNNVRGQLH